MSDYGVAPARQPDVRMPPDELLGARRALNSLAHAYSNAYVAEHPSADKWAVFFAVLRGLQDGVRSALDDLTSPAETIHIAGRG